MTDVSVRPTDLNGHEAELCDLLRQYFTEANEQGREWFDDDEFGADVDGIVAMDLDRLRSSPLSTPLVVALVDDDLVGSTQLKRLEPTAAELKRLYVAPSVRNEGVGRTLVETAIAAAASMGFETLRLGVAPYHRRAQALYRSLGFEPTPQYEQSQTPDELRDDWQFMARSLDP